VPHVPTIAEAGVSGYQSELWFGLLTSSQVPKAIIARLNSELRRVLSVADVKQRWTPIGLEPRPTTPVEFDKLIADDIELFTKIARAGNIKAE
jgi:tripartite-type tricarboxylate transporter receptor subunit TctC